MTTAEKRAELATRGEPWPTCPCHDSPLYWRGDRWRCRVKFLERQNRLYAARRTAGVCVRCAAPRSTGSMCESCADRHAGAQGRYLDTPTGRIVHNRAQSKGRIRQRAAEGFQSTGTGLAAFAAWLERPTGEV